MCRKAKTARSFSIYPALIRSHGPTLESLFAALPRPLPVPAYSVVSANSIPEPFHQLLVHDRHMTIAQERFHSCKIGVRVLQSQLRDGWYARQIVLIPRGTDRVVQGGAVRIHLHMLDPEVQTAIRREDTPLGHVLINHEVLRQIEVTRYLRIAPGDALKAWPGFNPTERCYARLGILHCDRQPAIEVFEIVPVYHFPINDASTLNPAP